MKCKECDLDTVGRSKYCTVHRAEARERFKALCEESKTVAVQRDAKHRELFEAAQRVAQEAFVTCEPTPMVVYEAEGLSDRPKANGKAWYVGEGVCGFAGVILMPATSSFVRWLAKHGVGRKDYHGGWHVSVYDLVPGSSSSQSYDRKVSAARAAAEVFEDAGMRVRVWDRLD